MRPEDAAAARGTLLGRAAAALVRLGILRPALTLLLVLVSFAQERRHKANAA